MNRRKSIQVMAVGALAPAILLGPTNSVYQASGEDILQDKDTHPNDLLWFRYPGRFWNSHAMHIGNGFLGLSFLGGVEEEIFAITEKTMWTGGPGENDRYSYGVKPGANKYLARIREMIASNQQEQIKEADQLLKKHFTGSSDAYGHFSAFGRLSLVFNHSSNQIQNYSRSLHLADAIANVQYDVKDTRYTREYFCSYPDKAAVLTFSSSKPARLSLILKWQVFQQEHSVNYTGNVYQLSGTINGNKRKFCLKMRVDAVGGRVYLNNGQLVVEGADKLTITLCAATEYAPVAPDYRGADPESVTGAELRDAVSHGTVALKKRHCADYQELYNRVKLSIPGDRAASALPSNERRERYIAATHADPGLKVLYFNLSRYLLISSSRPGSLPANLQGGWNMFEAAQWSGNYQSNINVQLNYSSACLVNLAECQQPYNDWIEQLVQPGRVVAREYYNTQGWVSHSIGNIWGYAAPGFELVWGMYPAGAAWHCHFIWKYFLYTQDMVYLQQKAYPVMREAAVFWIQNLVRYKGRLSSAPSASAEHGVYTENGKWLASGSSFDEEMVCLPGNFQDIQIVHELFCNCIKAAAVLKKDDAFVLALMQAKDELLPMKIGQYGQLQEWDQDVDDPGCNHRHIGHLYALWPANQISVNDKVFAAAAAKTLEMRGEKRNYKSVPHKDIYTASNWSLALRMACWLRLQQAERANQLFTQIISLAGFENLMTFQQVPQPASDKGNQSDLWLFTTPEGNWYPVWQIDCSLAMAGLVAEMLLQQDQEGALIFLPALPAEWHSGKVSGLKAPGNLTVDMEWKDMAVTSYRVSTYVPVKVILFINGRKREEMTVGFQNAYQHL